MSTITRIDMFVVPSGIQVMKYAEDWHFDPRARPTDRYLSATQLDEMILWLKDNGWVVRQWNVEGQTGARAWKETIRPVRTRAEIMRKRNQLKNARFWGATLDLAFDM